MVCQRHFFLCFSFNKLLLQKEELEQKHLHLLQVSYGSTVDYISVVVL